MQVFHINYHYDSKLEDVDDLLSQYRTITGWSEALVEKGLQVTVFQRFKTETECKNKGVRYLFVEDRWAGRLRSWHIPVALFGAIKKSRADIIHCHGFQYTFQTSLMRLRTPQSTGFIIQHHAEKPWGGIRREVQRHMTSYMDGFMFSAKEIGQLWIDKGNLNRRANIIEIMEGSNKFKVKDRQAARRKTGMDGNPVLLWVGRLIHLKDPLTVLKGLRAFFGKYPEARFYMIYHDDSLLPQIHSMIRESESLSKSVRMLGGIPYQDMEDHYNSADYFVLGSHYEGSGYALSEALACGLVPVVTDIPSFRMMTDDGRIGGLWQPGNPQSLTQVLIDTVAQSSAKNTAESRTFFERKLSFDAIADQAANVYNAIAEKRKRLILNA